MAKHEFGIMPHIPEQGKRYDEFEPQKYNCISVADEFLEDIDSKWKADCYWHTLDVKGEGLAFCGVTLIPPYSISSFTNLINTIPALSDLYALFVKAQKENRWIIHFGL